MAIPSSKIFSGVTFFSAVVIFFATLPQTVLAHEVYVLNHQEITQAIVQPSPNPFSAIGAQPILFLGWGGAATLLVVFVLGLSLWPRLQRNCKRALLKLKKFAPFIGRLTLGASLMASGYYGALFGPELPLNHIVSAAAAPTFAVALIVIGTFILLGFFTRWAAGLTIVLFAWTAFHYHLYMLTYLNYLGEMVLVFILGSNLFALDNFFKYTFFEKKLHDTLAKAEPYSFLILRVCFGAAVFFASFYAKFLHSNLALDTVHDYHLTTYFPFTPMFLVLGAFLIEALLGISFAIGFEIRFTTFVFTCFLILSIAFFGEAVWPHLILFGVNVALFAHGYDRYTIMKLFQKRIGQTAEPVL